MVVGLHGPIGHGVRSHAVEGHRSGLGPVPDLDPREEAMIVMANQLPIGIVLRLYVHVSVCGYNYMFVCNAHASTEIRLNYE